MSSIGVIYSLFPSTETTEKVIEELLEKRLIACANVFPQATSYFRWEGKMHKDQEFMVLFKTRIDLVELVMKTIENMHPYECPAVIQIEKALSNQYYYEWLMEEVRND